MIEGRVRTELTAENILKVLSEYDIFKFYMGSRKWTLNEACLSPLREEDNPSFLIGNRNGYLSWIDFGRGEHGNCFTFVQALYNCSYNEALKIIDRDFGLGICDSTNLGKWEQIKSSYKQPEEEKDKHYSIIQIVTRKFTKEELDYWASYYQDIEDLRANHIYSISKLFLNRKRFDLKETELRFGYFYPEEGKWKIYRPYNGKKTKWISNVPITVMDGKENILNCNIAFINKSRKDMMVVKKVFPCSCAVQNESRGCFSEENIEFLKANSNTQILSFDSDAPGVANSLQITNLFNFGYCNVPRKYLSEGIKDWAELGRVYGLKIIEDYLKERKIL